MRDWKPQRVAGFYRSPDETKTTAVEQVEKVFRNSSNAQVLRELTGSDTSTECIIAYVLLQYKRVQLIMDYLANCVTEVGALFLFDLRNVKAIFRNHIVG